MASALRECCSVCRNVCCSVCCSAEWEEYSLYWRLAWHPRYDDEIARWLVDVVCTTETYMYESAMAHMWRRLIGCLKLQVIFCKRSTNYRALLRKMTYKDMASYPSSPLWYGMAYVWMSRGTHMEELWKIAQRLVDVVGTTSTYMYESVKHTCTGQWWYTYECVMAYTWISHGMYMTQS